jgi:small subunit ribosomal protein S1
MIDSFDSSDDNFEDEPKAKKSNEFAQLLEASFKKPQKRLSVGDKIRGEILVMGKEDIFVSTGLMGSMSDGIVRRRDMLDPEGNVPYKVGDELDLYVIQVKGTEIFLSPKASAKSVADNLEDAFDMMIPVEGKVAEVCKGGVRVLISGKLAFCPISQLDIARVEKGDDYIGKKLEFMITQFSEGGRNIVVSRRKLLEEERGVSETAFAEERNEGQIVKGKVKRIEPFGAFVEVSPGIEGLLHVSELSYSRVEDPNEIVTVGQEIQVKILKKESKEGRLKISLSLKQAGAEPWDNLPVDIKEGNVVPGRVTRCMKFGAFVEIAPGLEGLVPLSEMSYTKRVMRSDELFKEGESILVMIKEMLPDTKRILLSLKDAGSDPWAMAPEKYAVGKIISGKLERREPYGLFISLEDGVTGLLPKSKAMENAEFSFEKPKLGDMITVQVAELRLGERRISLEIPSDANRDDWKGYTAQAATSGSFGTLADQFKKALEKKKK